MDEDKPKNTPQDNLTKTTSDDGMSTPPVSAPPSIPDNNPAEKPQQPAVNVTESKIPKTINPFEPKEDLKQTQTSVPMSLQTNQESDGKKEEVKNAITTQSPTNSPKFKIIVIVLLLVALLVYGYVGYLFITNKKIKSDQQPTVEPSTEITPSPLPTQVPQPVPSEEITITSGDVVRVTSGVTTILVNKDGYEDTGITGFSNVVVSPDESKMCFYSRPPAIKPAMYFSLISGESVIKIADRGNNCAWSSDSQKIAYTADLIGSGGVDINIYDLTLSEITNLTNVIASANSNLAYEILSWSSDDSTLNCSYQDTVATQSAITNCQIDTSTGTLTDT